MDDQKLLKQLTALLEDSPQTFPKLSEDQLSALYAIAFEFYRNGKYDDAKQFFRFLTIVNAFERRFWIGLGACYQMLKEYPAAIECYSVAAIQEPNDPYIHKHAADCFYANGQVAQAVRTLESALTVAKQQNGYEPLLAQLDFIHKTWKTIPVGG